MSSNNQFSHIENIQTFLQGILNVGMVYYIQSLGNAKNYNSLNGFNLTTWEYINLKVESNSDNQFTKSKKQRCWENILDSLRYNKMELAFYEKLNRQYNIEVVTKIKDEIKRFADNVYQPIINSDEEGINNKGELANFIESIHAKNLPDEHIEYKMLSYPLQEILKRNKDWHTKHFDKIADSIKEVNDYMFIYDTLIQIKTEYTNKTHEQLFIEFFNFPDKSQEELINEFINNN